MNEYNECENERFSLLQLEKDVNNYQFYRKKYNEHRNKTNNIFLWLFKKKYEKKKIKYYNEYVKSTLLLENNYRKVNIYTKFHEQIEYQYAYPLPSAPSAVVLMKE